MKRFLILAVCGLGLVGCHGDAPTAEPAPASASTPGEDQGKSSTGADLSINKDYQAPAGK